VGAMPAEVLYVAGAMLQVRCLSPVPVDVKSAVYVCRPVQVARREWRHAHVGVHAHVSNKLL
jgi:hypothetical protein